MSMLDKLHQLLRKYNKLFETRSVDNYKLSFFWNSMLWWFICLAYITGKLNSLGSENIGLNNGKNHRPELLNSFDQWPQNDTIWLCKFIIAWIFLASLEVFGTFFTIVKNWCIVNFIEYQTFWISQLL